VSNLAVRCCLLWASASRRWRTWHRGRCEAGRRGSRPVVRDFLGAKIDRHLSLIFMLLSRDACLTTDRRAT
jgi:hypothetical protein